MKKALFLLCVAVFCLFIFACGGGGGGNGSDDGGYVLAYPSEKLPEKMIGVTIVKEGWASREIDEVAAVGALAQKAKAKGIQLVSVHEDWNRYQMIETMDEWAILAQEVYQVKSQGLKCVVKFNVNTEGAWTAWPIDWFVPGETFLVSRRPEIAPWDSTYQTAWGRFLKNFTDYFSSTKVDALPDGMQITLGGSFGAQILGGYDYSSWSRPTPFLETLFQAEKWHIDTYKSKIGSIPKDYIVAVNSLDPADHAFEDQVGLYAMSKGAGWVQSNLGACSLKMSPDDANMLKRFQDAGAKISLEDIAATSCAKAGLSSDLSSRVSYIKEIQDTYGIQFSAVSISESDLDDEGGLAALKELLGL